MTSVTMNKQPENPDYNAIMSEQKLEEALIKYARLREYLKSFGSVAVAFSGGVDSTFLLNTAHDVLGNQAVAVTAGSCSFPERELREARTFCEKKNIRHFICDSEELEIDGFSANPVNRCYLCKKELFEKILAIAAEHNIAYVAEGSNMDDNGDYRPGLEAVAELNIKSPLRKAGLYKDEIRLLSRREGLSTWNKQSFACLASRIPYGEKITKEKLHMVDLAEQFLLDKGFSQVRVRVHGKTARIEILPAEFKKLVEIHDEVTEKLKSCGFTYVSMDLAGYRTGSMNETLKQLR